MEPSTLFDHVGELFYGTNFYPSLTRLSMVGKVIVDAFDQGWRIESEEMWNNLNVTPSDQEREGFPCRITGAVDVIKSRLQIVERRRPIPVYHGKFVGDKLSGLLIKSKMESNHCSVICSDAFEMIKLHRTTRTEYNDCYLAYILTELYGKRSMVFTRTSEATKVVVLMLRSLGLRALPFNGHMTQAERLGALNKFRAGDYNILVTTDVAIRGRDIDVVDMVVNYDIPSNSMVST